MKPTIEQLRGAGYASVMKSLQLPNNNKMFARTIEVFAGGGTFWWTNYAADERDVIIEEVAPVDVQVSKLNDAGETTFEKVTQYHQVPQ